MNLYRYCGNNPINHSDPTGLVDQSAWNRLMTWQDGGDGAVSEQLNDNKDKPKSISTKDEGVKKGMVAGAIQVYKSLLKWVRKIDSAARMTAEFIEGSGPAERVFGPNSPESNDLRSDPKYQAALGKASVSGQLENVDFGMGGALRAGLHPTRQFVGSYKVGVNKDGSAYIYNQTSAWSGLYHPPFLSPLGHERPGPGGNTTQIYIMRPESSE